MYFQYPTAPPRQTTVPSTAPALSRQPCHRVNELFSSVRATPRTHRQNARRGQRYIILLVAPGKPRRRASRRTRMDILRSVQLPDKVAGALGAVSMLEEGTTAKFLQ